MGTWLALQTLEARSQRGRLNPKIKNVLFVAPDIATPDFERWLQALRQPRPRIALFVSSDDQALKLSQSIWGGQRRLGDADPREEPYHTEFERNGVLVFDLTGMRGGAHSRAFEDVQSVMGMVAQRLAAGQQWAGDRQPVADAGQ
jgi:esterase/lipase superfamily enzyme